MVNASVTDRPLRPSVMSCLKNPGLLSMPVWSGPYPDQTGMLNNPGFFRQDITEGRSGLSVTLALTIVNVNNACAALANANVEIWQCDASGNYSEYAQPGYNGTGQTFLR